MTEQVFHQVRIRDVVAETADAHSLVLEVPPELGEKFTYKPGQFLTVRIPSDETGSVLRSYSLSSSPYEPGHPKITVKRTADGYASNWICDNVCAGGVLETMRPAGKFTPKSLDENFLLFAGGSGITPVMSILRSALIHGRGRIVLVYANRDQDNVIFGDELRRLGQEHADRLLIIHWLESVQRLPSVIHLRELARPFSSYEMFICGPDPYMQAVAEALDELGVPRRRVHQERFISLPGNAEEIPETERPAAPPTDESRQPAAVEVLLDGETHEFEWPAETKLLDLVLSKGLDAPFSCREGQCSACTCKLVDGEVKLLHNEVLDEQDLREGYILACQAVPVSDNVKVTYDE